MQDKAFCFASAWMGAIMVQLTSKWWKDLKPKGFDGRLENALKDFEKAVRTKNSGQVLDALMAIRFELPSTNANLKKKFKANPVKQKILKLELKELEKLIDREEKLVVSKGAKAIKVWSRDFSEEVKKQTNVGFLHVVGGKVDVKLNLMTIHALENSGTEARFFRALDDVFKNYVNAFADKIQSVGENGNYVLALSNRQAYKLQGLARKYVIKLRETLEKQANWIIEGAACHHRTAKIFKKQRAMQITMASLGVAGGAAGIAMPGTTALAIVALVRSTAKLVEEVVSILMTLEAKYKSLCAQVKLLSDSYDKGTRGKKELAKTTVNALVGADVMVTYKAAVARLDDFMGSISVVADKVNLTQLKILSAISKLGDLNKTIKQNLENPQLFRNSLLGLKIASLEGNLDKMLDKMSDTMGRVVKAEKRVLKLKTKIDELGENSVPVQRAEQVIPIVVNLAFSIGSFSDGIAASQQALNVTANVLGIANDAAGELVGIAN